MERVNCMGDVCSLRLFRHDQHTAFFVCVWWNTRRFIDSRPKCDGQVKLFSRHTLLRFESGNCSQRNRKWLSSRALKVLCLQLYFRNDVRSDAPRLGNTPAFRRQLSLDSRIRKHYFIFVAVIRDSVEVLKVNALDIFFFIVLQPIVDQGLFVTQSSFSDISQSIEILWTRDQPDAENSTWHHIATTRDR